MKDQEKETLFDSVCKKNMRHWNLYQFKQTHPLLFKSIIEAISPPPEEQKVKDRMAELIKEMNNAPLVFVRQEDGWVSVKDRLPELEYKKQGKFATIENSKEVLVFDGTNVFPDSYQLEGGFHSPITHWRTFESIGLPKAPEKEEE